jgi:hypothetical protein
MFLLLDGVGVIDRLRGRLLSRHGGLRVYIRGQKRRCFKTSLTWCWNNGGAVAMAARRDGSGSEARPGPRGLTKIRLPQSGIARQVAYFGIASFRIFSSSFL